MLLKIIDMKEKTLIEYKRQYTLDELITLGLRFSCTFGFDWQLFRGKNTLYAFIKKEDNKYIFDRVIK